MTPRSERITFWSRKCQTDSWLSTATITTFGISGAKASAAGDYFGKLGLWTVLVPGVITEGTKTLSQVSMQTVRDAILT